MSNDRQNDREKRDEVLARLLADALDRESGTPEAAGGSPCPEPELIAAYADHGLDPEETARCEKHFAACGRCRKILAVLTVSSEEPLSEREIERFGQLAAKVEVAPVPAQARRPRVWRWLAPALGAAAGVLLWFALRPALPGETRVPRQTTEDQLAQQAAAPRSSELPESGVPAPPPPPMSAAATPAPQAAPAGSSSAAAKAGREQAENQADSSSAPAAPARKTMAQRPVETAKAPTAGNVPSATPATPPAAATLQNQVAEPAVRATTPKTASRTGAMTLRMGSLAQGTGFASPDRSVMWQIGPDGAIDRSTNNGQTWQKQESGVTSVLLAGTAPSNDVAWVAGRGVILRTTDGGDHWQRVPSPGGGTAEWTGIAASDAIHVTVTGSDGRRYHSEDGGKTWTQQR